MDIERRKRKSSRRKNGWRMLRNVILFRFLFNEYHYMVFRLLTDDCTTINGIAALGHLIFWHSFHSLSMCILALIEHFFRWSEMVASLWRRRLPIPNCIQLEIFALVNIYYTRAMHFSLLSASLVLLLLHTRRTCELCHVVATFLPLSFMPTSNCLAGAAVLFISFRIISLQVQFMCNAYTAYGLSD